MILDTILKHKRAEVAAAQALRPLAEVRASAEKGPAPRGFAATMRAAGKRGTAIIAEVKKGSPSKGVIREDFHPVDIALRYQAGGATCLSVLTDAHFFLGDLNYLREIRAAVTLPLLRKDFIIDPYQVYEARCNGADAILLIAAALDREPLRELAELAVGLGLDVLLEVHNEQELEVALQMPVELIGINNRDLSTFETSLEVTERLLPLIPDDRLVVSESGIGNREDIRRLQRAGARGFLIGESLMREADVQAKLESLLHD